MAPGKRKAGSDDIKSSHSKRRKAAVVGKRGGGRSTGPSAQRLAAAIRGATTGGSKRHSSRLTTRQALLEVHADTEFDAPRSVAGLITSLDGLRSMRLIRPSGGHAPVRSSAVHRCPHADYARTLTGSRRRTATG